MAQSVGLDAQSEEAIVDPPPRCVNGVELELAAQSQRSSKTKAAIDRLHGAPGMGVPRTLRNDLLAALGATTRKNLLSAGGLHARAKSRGALATQLARLISAFHMIGSRPLISRKKGREGYAGIAPGVNNPPPER